MENAIQLYFISLFYNLNAVSFFRSLIFLKLFFFLFFLQIWITFLPTGREFNLQPDSCQSS